MTNRKSDERSLLPKPIAAVSMESAINAQIREDPLSKPVI
jgi:hypothetical protein